MSQIRSTPAPPAEVAQTTSPLTTLNTNAVALPSLVSVVWPSFSCLLV